MTGIIFVNIIYAKTMETMIKIHDSVKCARGVRQVDSQCLSEPDLVAAPPLHALHAHLQHACVRVQQLNYLIVHAFAREVA